MSYIIGCLHAHHANISYIDRTLRDDIQYMHFVDPGFIHQINTLTPTEAVQHVQTQLRWIAQCGVDAILMTCTNMIACCPHSSVLSIPIIKVDEPFFEAICQKNYPQTLLFINPATIDGTMVRLHAYSAEHQQRIHIKPFIILRTFDLIMNDDKIAYDAAIKQFLQTMNFAAETVSVAQLSMVDAATAYCTNILHPLLHIGEAIAQQLSVKDVEL